MFKRVLLPILLGGCSLAAAVAQNGEPPELRDARITIPYSELKELWKAAQQNNQPATAKPPVAAELLSARYEVDLSNADAAVGFVEFEAQSFSAEWASLPLVDRETPVHKIEPAEANVILKEDAYTLLTERAARHQVRLHFAAPLRQEGDSRRLQLSQAAALVSLVTVRGVPADRTLHIPQATLVSRQKDAATWRVAPRERIELQLLPATTAARTPSEWQVASQCFVAASEKTLRYEAHLDATTTAGSGVALTLSLPAGARVLNVTSDDLASWRFDDSAEARRVELEWRTAGILNRQVEVVYEVPQASETQWQLQAPEVVNGASLAPVFGINAGTEVELRNADDSPALSNAPRWLTGRLASIPNTLLTRSAQIKVKPLQVIEAAPAVVESAQFQTRVVADGALITEQTYAIRTQSAVAWAVELPPESELLSCAVNDHRTNPIDRGEGRLEVPIAPSSDNRPTRVTLAYTAKRARFQPVAGSLRVELPKTPLLINSLQWDLAIPAEYEIAALEGNVAPAPGAPARDGSTVVRLKKDLCRNERPEIELFYQKPEANK